MKNTQAINHSNKPPLRSVTAMYNKLNTTEFKKKLSWRQTIVFVGAIFISGLINTPEASAMSVLNISSSAISDSSAEKIEKFNKDFESKYKDIEDKIAKVDQFKKESEKAIKKAISIEEQIELYKEEIKQLKIKIAEKKKLEAMRVVNFSGNTPGNAYAAGNCTWYVKTRRPDIGNYWGNANAWLASAQAAGYQTGSKAKTGAIGVSFEGTFGHVVYVEEWLGDGKITISEMNYAGLYSQRTREASETEFTYIYSK